MLDVDGSIIDANMQGPNKAEQTSQVDLVAFKVSETYLVQGKRRRFQ
jgi:hypothetical protein